VIVAERKRRSPHISCTGFEQRLDLCGHGSFVADDCGVARSGCVADVENAAVVRQLAVSGEGFGCGLACFGNVIARHDRIPRGEQGLLTQYDLWLLPFFVMLPISTRLVVHFYSASLLAFLFIAFAGHVVSHPLSLQLTGAVVLYRLLILVLIGRECWRMPDREQPTIALPRLEAARSS
jgi:hypothetical protein